MLIDGKKIAQGIIDDLKLQPGPKKFLGAVLVGSDASSANFLKQKKKVAGELGIDFRLYEFPERSGNDDLRKKILEIAQHKTCGGIIVQLPLPQQINRHYVLNVIPREKDIDVLGERALGAFYAGRNPVLPPAVGATEAIINFCNLQLESLRAAVIGRGLLVGKPIATWLMDKVRELGVFGNNSGLSEIVNFDLAVSGTGQAGLIKPSMLKKGAVLIDFGYSIDKNGKISGDFDINSLKNPELKDRNLSYTPTPGGTGPILVAELIKNFYQLNKENRK